MHKILRFVFLIRRLSLKNFVYSLLKAKIFFEWVVTQPVIQIKIIHLNIDQLHLSQIGLKCSISDVIFLHKQ